MKIKIWIPVQQKDDTASFSVWVLHIYLILHRRSLVLLYLSPPVQLSSLVWCPDYFSYIPQSPDPRGFPPFSWCLLWQMLCWMQPESSSLLVFPGHPHPLYVFLFFCFCLSESHNQSPSLSFLLRVSTFPLHLNCPRHSRLPCSDVSYIHIFRDKRSPFNFTL